MKFKKGKSGNPGGRPKEKPFADALRMELAAAGEDHKKLRAIAQKLLDKAEAGDMPAINTIADRLDGRVPQAIIGDSDEDSLNVKAISIIEIVAPKMDDDGKAL